MNRKRNIFLALLFLWALVLPGCATRGRVQRLEDRVDRLERMVMQRGGEPGERPMQERPRFEEERMRRHRERY